MKIKKVHLFTAITSMVLLCRVFAMVGGRTMAFDLFNNSCTGGDTSNSAVCTDKGVSQTPGSNSLYGKDGILTKGAGLLSLVVGITSVVMIMFGGLKYINSRGDPAKAAGAKNTIVYSVIGLVLAIFAQAIIIFVLNKL